MVELKEQVRLCELKMKQAEDWFETIDFTDKRFEEAFTRYRAILNERARLYLLEIEPVQLEMEKQ
jgi:hypothetical protein